jgi:isopenicillin N synthase-like dioxygenase
MALLFVGGVVPADAQVVPSVRMWQDPCASKIAYGFKSTRGLNVPDTAPLPWLDLSRLDGRATDHLNFLADLREAAHDVGFFYLTGHGITAKQCEEVLVVARRFFTLPEAAKLEVEMIHSPHFRGYTRAGRELTRGRPDWREQFDINRDRARYDGIFSSSLKPDRPASLNQPRSGKA